MMLIRIIIMLLIALFVESRQEAFGQNNYRHTLPVR